MTIINFCPISSWWLKNSIFFTPFTYDGLSKTIFELRQKNEELEAEITRLRQQLQRERMTYEDNWGKLVTYVGLVRLLKNE